MAGLLCLPAQSQGHGGDAIANGTLTAIRNQDEILPVTVSLYAGTVAPGFLLVQDNAQLHVARVRTKFLDDEATDATDWHSRFPELNPNEHLWEIM